MPINLLKLTTFSSLPLHHHHRRHQRWLRHAITAGNSKPPPAMFSSWWRITPCGPVAQDNNNNNNSSRNFRNSNFSGRLGFRGQKNFGFSSSGGEGKGKVSGGGKVSMGSVNTGSRDDKWTTECDRGVSVMSALPSQNHRHPKQPASQPNPSAKLLTLPTILTLGRVAAVPLIIGTFYMNSRLGTTATTGIFIAAAITDWLDGYLARRMNLGTVFGAFLDPVADKLMVAATLVLLCTRPPEAAMVGQFPWLLTIPAIAIIGREITMSAVREWAASQGSKLSEAVAVNNLGKWKTATQMTSLTILLTVRDSSFTEAGLLGATGVALLYVSAGLAVWSLVVYMKKIWKVLLM